MLEVFFLKVVYLKNLLVKCIQFAKNSFTSFISGAGTICNKK